MGNSYAVERGTGSITGSQVCGALSEKTAYGIGLQAGQALLEEVYTTPKPGLVDLCSCGAHTDMNVHTFERSAQALTPYFIRMAYQGCMLSCSCEELFRQIRRTGLAAEQAMYRATDGVNTHKGLIFTLGIYCAAAGRCIAERGRVTEQGVREIQQRMTVRILTEELAGLRQREAVSHGEENLHRYGTAGIRGEAIEGYRPVWEEALPVLREGSRSREDSNSVKLQTLFVLMRQVDDSNILARRGPKTLGRVKREAADFLGKGGAYRADAIQELMEMDAEYSRQNISPGGSADLLAAAVFLQKILERN
ncbi:MAG: triphosphoribosyl-dephospho-CoA synthase CitG [Lachnospiraceae bacterium]|nr:triphosphoribosyl-dephospho-CoA synthase CitG [Lachnospiraceae bacterium]